MLLATPLAAQELRIGMKAAVDGSDPHQSFSPNHNVQLQVYEPLVFQDALQRPISGLAESWRLLEPDLWEFILRPGVVFHDGSPLTTADVIFSFERGRDIRGLRTYGPALRGIAALGAVDDRRLRIRTHGPLPLLPAYLTSIAVVSAAAATEAGEAEFNGGRAAIGTGPYRWVRFTRGSDVVLERAAQHWAPPEPWSRVIYRFIPNDSARVAALLAGDVDIIAAVPSSLTARVREGERTQLVVGTSSFDFYTFYDQFRDRPLFASGLDGQALGGNPFRDARVRAAISHALDRTALADHAMEGTAVPAGQIAPPGFIGHDPDLAPPRFDPALARRLLAEAGFPQGFALTIHCTADRFAGDARSCQAIGQMLTVIGIRTTVETVPTVMFFRRANAGANGEPEFTVSLSIFASTTGVASEGMNSILRTWNATLGHGASNRGHYSDAVLDGLLSQVESTLDDTAREAFMRQAVRRAMEQNAVTPVFFLRTAWGVRRGLTLAPRGDQYTMATAIRPTP